MAISAESTGLIAGELYAFDEIGDRKGVALPQSDSPLLAVFHSVDLGSCHQDDLSQREAGDPPAIGLLAEDERGFQEIIVALRTDGRVRHDRNSSLPRALLGWRRGFSRIEGGRMRKRIVVGVTVAVLAVIVPAAQEREDRTLLLAGAR